MSRVRSHSKNQKVSTPTSLVLFLLQTNKKGEKCAEFKDTKIKSANTFEELEHANTSSLFFLLSYPPRTKPSSEILSATAK